MSEPIFREKSLKKIQSPDQLNEYIHVANPGVWTILTAVIFLLAGFCLWSVFGTLTTAVNGDAYCENGNIICYLSQEDAGRISVGMTAQIGTTDGVVSGITVENGRSFCSLTANELLPDGIYKVVITIESIHPAAFLTN